MLEHGLQRIGFDTGSFRKFNWTKWVLVLITLSIAATIGMTGVRQVFRGRTLLEMGILGILMLVVVGLVLYRLELGLLAIVFTSFFVRFSIPTGTATTIPASLVVSCIVVLIWLLSMLLKRQVQLAPGHYVLPALLFILISVLSIPYSWLLLRPELFGHGNSGKSGLGFAFVQVGAVTLMVLLPTVMLMAANVLRDVKWFKILFALMIIVAVPELLQRFTGLKFAVGDFKLQTGASYSLWIVALSLGQALFNQNLQGWQRALLVAITGMWLFFGTGVTTIWFSGWMPSMVAVVFLSFFRSKKLFLGLLIAGLVVLAFRADYFIGYVWNDAVHSDSNRFEIWRIIVLDLTLTKTNIIFGAGPAGYLPFYETYYPGHAWVSHNNYIDILAELGLVGAGIFLWLLFGVVRTGWEQRNRMPTGFTRGFNYGVLGGFVGTLFAMGLGDWFIPFVYNIGIPGFDFAVYGWLLTGAMLALNYLKLPETVQTNDAK